MAFCPRATRAARPWLIPALVPVVTLAASTPAVGATHPVPESQGRSAVGTPTTVTEGVPGDDVPDLGKPRDGDRLGSRDRQALARAQDAGRRTVTVLVATARGQAPLVSREVTDLGGTVRYSDRSLGYVRAVLPTGAVERTANLRGVFGVDLNERFRVPDPRPGSARTGATARAGTVVAPGPDTPAANPFLPTREIGAPQFVARHPRWDGRGVTIGVLDTGVDLDHPALRTTTTGEPKIVDWVTATDPLVDGDGTWRPMLTTVTGPTFGYGDRQWTSPAGDFRVNLFEETATEASELGGDVNRDGDTSDDWGVLYRAADNAVWVDTDDDGDFTDEELRRPYREGRQVGHFGTDDPSTPVREALPFVVEFREDVDLTADGQQGHTADFVNIGIVSDAHGTHVAGIAAGHRLFGGAMSGAAPGARIVSSRACTFGGGCTDVALVEGMIDLVTRRGVDVVNVSIGGLPALNDGDNARAVIYNRLIADYGVQLFLSAGNEGPGLNTVSDPSVTTDAVSVAASVTRRTWQANYGARVSARHQIFSFSSRGPREDGGLKPDLTAPGAAVSTTPTWLPGRPAAEAGYELPPGYAMYNGTSMAAPEAAGGAALLLSAGKDADVPITPAGMRTSLTSTARFDDDLPSFAQGMGQLRVGRAWRLLRRIGSTAPSRYDVSAPVCSALSSYLSEPGRGTGIYNRCPAGAGGQVAGRTRTYRVQITRRSGPTGSREHALRWRGNDGTFSAPASVRLPLGKPATVTVRARASLGAHAAILLVDDPSTRGVDRAVSAVVVSATGLSALDYTWSIQDTVERTRTRSYFVTVPEGAEVLRVRLSDIAAASQVRFLAFHPYGVGVEDNSSLNCYTSFSDPEECSPTSRTYIDPTPGVWELTVESRRTTPYLVNPFSLTAAVRGVAVDPPLREVPTATVGRAVPVSWTLSNRFAPVTITASGGELGSAFATRPTIADGETHTYSVVVPAGASRLDVGIGNPSDPGADLDLTVLKDGVVVGQSADGDSEEAVRVQHPEAGRYEVEVYGYAVPAGTTAYDYRDVYYAAALGTLEVDKTPFRLGSGETAELAGSVTPQARPGDGRSLLGEVSLRDPEGSVLGMAGVLLTDVRE